MFRRLTMRRAGFFDAYAKCCRLRTELMFGCGMMTTYADLDQIDAKYALYKRAKERRAELAYGFVAREFPEVIERDRASRATTLTFVGVLIVFAIAGGVLLFRAEPTLAVVFVLVALAISGTPGWLVALRAALAEQIPKKELPDRERVFALAYAWVDTQENYRRYGAIVRQWESPDGKRFRAWPSDRRDH